MPEMVAPPVGASLVFATAMSKVSLAVGPAPSLAVTVTLSVPTSPLPGVPLNVRVVPSNVNQAGRAPPPNSVAL
ncbi:hypothetical protein EEB15_27690 [Ramlibacter sp. WS9]|nr:hypothetical protein EEB15_27690 [Ramlibacter sp. WS9]